EARRCALMAWFAPPANGTSIRAAPDMRIYRWLLRLCPAALRRDYEAAMVDTFVLRLADARRAGAWPYMRVWSRELSSVLALAIVERIFRRSAFSHHQTPRGRMETISQDLQQAARRLVRSPAFTLAAVLTLALAIGANASIFAVVERVVLNPLPYPESDRLVD